MTDDKMVKPADRLLSDMCRNINCHHQLGQRRYTNHCANHVANCRSYLISYPTIWCILLALSTTLGLVLDGADCLTNQLNNNNGRGNDPSRVYVVKQANSPTSSKSIKQTFREHFDQLTVHVKENTQIGTKIAEIQPRDNDSHVYSEQNDVMYAIVGGIDAFSFTLRVDNVTKKVELINEIDFDYESGRRNYHVAIRATSVYMRYEVEVDVLVVDENDNKPLLEDFSIVFNNYKNNFPTGPIGRVPATDLDQDDVLHYRVLSGNNAQLIYVNETTGDIQLSPWLNSNVPLKAVMEIAVSDGLNEAVAKLALTVNLVTETMLHNSVVLRLDGVSRDNFLSKKFDLFQREMATILGLKSMYGTKDIVIFDVDEYSTPAYKSASLPSINSTTVSVNVSFSARAEGNDVEAYLSSQYIEERVFLSRMQLSQSLEVQVAPFQDNLCLHEPCQNYQECQATYKFDRAPKVFYTNRNMIFRPIKATQSFACNCPQSYTGMKHKSECNLQINPCFSTPCLNGGVCHRHESGYSCECKSSEFLGPRCEFSFANSTCQSIAQRPHSTSSLLDPSSNPLISPNSLDTSPNSVDSSSSYTKLQLQPQQQLPATMCSGKSRCVNVNKSYYYPGKPTSSLTGGFTCQGCPYQEWSNQLCQLRARSFDKNSFLTLPSLRRRHRFHLMLQFSTVQTDALLLYNGRYNDKHDFIALEIVNSRLRFSYSLGVNSGVESVCLSTIAVSDGNWHKVAVDYRDRNVTLVVDDCDPVIDEALARVQGALATRRCSNSTTFAPPSDQGASVVVGQEYKMLDLTSPMQLGALASYLPPTINEPRISTQSGFVGCISDFYIDHQLVDLSVPIQDFGTQPGCSDRRTYCQQYSCNGNPCQDSFGATRCQCGDDHVGKSCEIIVSPEKVRKFSGNSYLTINPLDQMVPAQWQVSMHFRTINPNGILLKIALNDAAGHETSVVLELFNGGLKMTHRSTSLLMSKTPLDDGEWHFLEMIWSGDSTLLQLDYIPNLSVQSQEFGNVIGQTIKYIIVGSSSARSIPSGGSGGIIGSSGNNILNENPSALPGSSALQSDAPSPPEYSSGSTPVPEDLSSVYLYGGSNSSSQSFVGCIYGLNISDSIEWWMAPSDERNIERGCMTVDVCDTNPCPANSKCVKRGMNQRKCICNQGFVGDQCLPVCDLNPCQGVNSRCVANLRPSADSSEQPASRYPVEQSASQSTSSPSSQYTCECEPLRSGKNCENQLSAKCPSNWWGKPVVSSVGGSSQMSLASVNSSICGPCNCDESRGFDGDCDKTTGQCFCKQHHYQPPNSDYCLPCDCYLVGSLSSTCNQTSGQCKCRPGVVGRRCDTCTSPYAEVTLRGCDVIYDACPKTFSDGIWWEKTQLDRVASAQCPPSTSTGMATRFCHKTEGWRKANLFDCISNTFADLYAQYQFLEENKFQMSTGLAMKIASNLRTALNETISSPSMQLYGSDMYIAFRLIHHLVQHESHQTGLNLTHRQDRMYIRNIVESVSYILDPAYAENLPEIAARSNDGGFEHLLRLFDQYGKVLIESQSDTFTQPFEISAKYFTFGMDMVSTEQLWDLSKWSTGASPSTSLLGNQPLGSHYPSSPPYATDPFDQFSSPSLDGRPLSSRHGEQQPAGHFNSDGVSVYLDYGAASSRDPASPAVVIPKFDNNPLGALDPSNQNDATKILIPLRTLRVKTPQDLFLAGAARSRAKREELIIPDFNNIRQKPALVVYSIYKSIGPLLPNDYDNSVQNRLGVLATANSPVVWLTMRAANSSEIMGKHVQPKITYMLKIVEPSGRTRPQCAIWDFVSSPVNALQNTNSPVNKNQSLLSNSYGIKKTGRFTTKGCEIKGIHPNHRLRYKYDYVNCSCDHLGAVTVLMDNAANFDYLTGEETNFKDLAIMISLLLSIILLLATMFVLSCIRGHSIKSNSNSINKNLIFILIIIELMIFYTIYSRSSLNQREYQCKLVAIFLHYFSISLFSWLMVNAIHFFRMLTELRDINHGPMKFYYVLGYAVPAFFVSIAVGLRIEQFGNYLFCWLSIHEAIIWSMFGPISVISLFIMILFGLALSRSLPIKEDLTGAELIKSHMLINITKTPLIGITWLITVYAVNESLMDYVYIFPILTVFKSVVLFVLLCIVDKYIRYNLYVSWLRFRGEKISFVEPEYSYSQEHWFSPVGAAGGVGLPNPLIQGKDYQTSAAHLYSGTGQVMTPGFQSSCADIFRPELLAFSAASTTSRSSASETSSSVAYRDHYGRHRVRKSHRVDNDEVDDDEYDDNDAGDYGRTGRSRGHRRRHKSKAHRKHHHHKHHHHHHHNHRSHRGQEDDEASHGHGSHENKYDDRHHHHHHHHHRSAADYGHHGGRSRRHNRHGHYGERTASDQHPSQQQRQHLLENTNSASPSNQNDGLASSHSSDADDGSTLPKTKIYGTANNQTTANESGAPSLQAQTVLDNEDQRQTVPMELLSPSTSGTQQQSNEHSSGSVNNENASESNIDPSVANTST